MTWHPIKTHPPTASDWIKDKQAVEFYSTANGTRWVTLCPQDVPSTDWTDWTHWRPVELAPPPEKELSQFQKDQEAAFEASHRRGYSPTNVPGQHGVYMFLDGAEYARKSLREEIKSALNYANLERIAKGEEENGHTIWANCLRQLSRLLEGEEGK